MQFTGQAKCYHFERCYDFVRCYHFERCYDFVRCYDFFILKIIDEDVNIEQKCIITMMGNTHAEQK